MKFQKNSRRLAAVYEKDLVRSWKEDHTFEKSVEQRPADNAYVFYDGPPFITGTPHHGTLLSSIIKDAVPRYWTMKGKRVERRWGWDCHGLPAEVFTEKRLGIHDRRDIGTKISLETYILTCRENMVATGSLWEDTIDRIGRWVDFKGAYRTMDKDYMESVWWAFKELYDKGKIYEGEKVLLYCVRDATPISKAEVAMDNSYQEDTEPSVYVKLRLKDVPEALLGDSLSAGQPALPVFLLAWTTTPWTLPANTGAAINRELEYAAVQVADEIFILAKDLVERALQDEKHNVVSHTVLSSFTGDKLLDLGYEPLFEDRGDNAHKIWHADYVNLEEGTGVVHLAPAYGEEDYALAKAEHFPFILNIDDNGFFDSGPWVGQYVWDANKQIAKDLHQLGTVWRIDYVRHSYPHCHRCGTKLMYRAHPSWFMDIDGQRQQMLEQNADITWFPDHIKAGRFAKTVESAPDWNLSRDRFWATAMPVWKGVDDNGKEHIKIVGSYAELKELSGVELEDYHRPWVDDVTFTIDGVEYHRIDKVLDCWFESGSMPFAQFHYPFENRDKFEASFPGDFIAEYVGQVRAWFYSLHAVSVGLFGRNAFKNVVVTGTLAGNDGRKMSKSFGNYTDPNELMDTYGADALRFLLLSSPVLNGEDFSLQDKDVADISRKLSMIGNMYDFFTLYADVDGWDSGLAAGELPSDPLSQVDFAPNLLDEWIISRLHQLMAEVDTNMQRYDLPNALKPILPFVDDASNWYVRRSRKRFWKSGNDADKTMAYQTLHYVLVQLSLVLAPFTPFLAEELYRQLTGGESVHLCDWPPAGKINNELLQQMAQVRGIITVGLAARARAGLKVRQPLASVSIDKDVTLPPAFEEIIKEELNVKAVIRDQISEAAGRPVSENVAAQGLQQGVAAVLDTDLTPELLQEGLMREVVRHVQTARKQAGLQVDDRIVLALDTRNQALAAAVTAFADTIAAETLATDLTTNGTAEAYSFNSVANIDAAELAISLQKA
jgi:isoleucyl-tRNA synthetase